ncbi:MAG: hypothetical protein GY821_07595 [Gammaproteobacteria bacterium]|nr:hypothetical protein [Gammaproteobacteria bacterium]
MSAQRPGVFSDELWKLEYSKKEIQALSCENMINEGKKKEKKEDQHRKHEENFQEKIDAKGKHLETFYVSATATPPLCKFQLSFRC